MAKEFVFDHSYWSVNVTDDHFADQEEVSCNMSQFTDCPCRLHVVQDILELNSCFVCDAHV